MSQRFQPVLSLLLALALTAAVMAQASKPALPRDQSVLTSGDIGFRVESYDGGTPVGTLVVRINGRWLEPKSAAGLQLLHPR